MNNKEKKELLSLARNTIIATVSGQPLPALEESTVEQESQSGCFVTIKQNGQLRGCIGTFVSRQPLWQTIREMAVSASTRDPRFYPMKKHDLENFTLEISVLSPLMKASSIEEIIVGTHGIYIIKGAYQGVLLPQVATEYAWDRETFLRQTCRKAGLPEDAWQKDCDIYIFSAEIFGEEPC
mgnify:CR=1 FL=1